MTLAEAIETRHLASIAGLVGERTTLLTTRLCRVLLIPSPMPGWSASATCRCRVKYRWCTTGCGSLMNCWSAAAMSCRSGGNRSRRVSYSYNRMGVLELNSITALAARLMILRE
jgi:hypothetical protein